MHVAWAGRSTPLCSTSRPSTAPTCASSGGGQVLELRRHGGDVAANGGVGALREEPRQEKKETHGSMVVRGSIPGSVACSRP